jgi:hypothetical protein
MKNCMWFTFHDSFDFIWNIFFGFIKSTYIVCFWKLSTPQTLVLIISFPIKVAIFGIYPVFSHSPFPSSGHRAVSGHHFAESRRRAGGCCQRHCLVVLHAVSRFGAMGYWGPRSKSRSVASKLPYSDGPTNSCFYEIIAPTTEVIYHYKIL